MPVLFAFITHIGTAFNFLGEGSVYIFPLKQTSFTRTKNQFVSFLTRNISIIISDLAGYGV